MKTVSDPESPESLTAGDDLRGALVARFGLSFDPFSRASGFFYAGARRGHSLKTLQHLAAFGDRVLWVAGPQGMGKTRLVSEFCLLEKDLLDIRLLEARTLSSVEALEGALQALSQQRIERGQTERGASVSAFFRWSENLPSRGRRLVLILDDAEKVPSEVLEALVQGFAQANRSSAAVPVVVASRTAAGCLADAHDPALLDWVHEIELPPLEAGEIAEFLDQAFVHAGGQPVSERAGRVLSELEVASGGNIGVLQRRAPAVLLGQSARHAGSRKSRRLSWRWAMAGVILLVASFALISLEYRGRSSGHQALQETAQPAREMIHLSLQQAQQTMASHPGMPQPVAPASSGADHASAPLPLRTADSSGSVAAGTTGQTSAAAAAGSAVADSAAMDSASPDKPSPAAAPSAAVSPSTSPPVGSMPADRSTATAEQAAQAPAQPASPAPAKKDKTGDAVALSKSPVTSGPGAVSSGQKATKSPDKRTGGFTAAVPEKYTQVSRLNGEDGFIVQLSGSHDERYAVATLRQFPLVSLHYTRTTYQGQPWFVVFMGPYPSANQARKAIQSLPAGLRRGGPWVRKARGL